MGLRFPRLPKAIFKSPPGFKKPKVKDFKADMQRLGEEIAEEFKDKVVENIETNRFGFSLSQSTIKKKGSSIPLIDSRTLIEAIYRDEAKVSVENSPRTDSKLTNLQLAIVQEYGTKDKHIPARPVWRNTYKEFKPKAKKRIGDFLGDQKFKNNE